MTDPNEENAPPHSVPDAKSAEAASAADVPTASPTEAAITPASLLAELSEPHEKTADDILRELRVITEPYQPSLPTVAELLHTPSVDAGYTWHEQTELEEEIHGLKRTILFQAQESAKLKKGSEEQKSEISSLKDNIQSLRVKEQLRHLLDRVGKPARNALLSGIELKTLFEEHQQCNAYVISIDVRRSTELMLKAREPQFFAEFITTLANDLKSVILANYGVFDKFTGDGILAFFPDFFSGDQAGLLAVDAAQRCHDVFAQHYREQRKCFITVLRDTGLGIGIDYGRVNVVQMAGELTIVGTPVVYACRLGGAEAGQTLVNQPAYESLLANFSEYIDFAETEISFKHEGAVLAYAVSRNEKRFAPCSPNWAQSEGQT